MTLTPTWKRKKHTKTTEWGKSLSSIKNKKNNQQTGVVCSRGKKKAGLHGEELGGKKGAKPPHSKCRGGEGKKRKLAVTDKGVDQRGGKHANAMKQKETLADKKGGVLDEKENLIERRNTSDANRGTREEREGKRE